jgi:hypothetical protein
MTYLPPQVSEVPDLPVEDCAAASDLMAANKATTGDYPANRAERERIRTATGKPHGGLTVADINHANRTLYGNELTVANVPFSRFLSDYMALDYGAVLLGNAHNLTSHYNRWDPGFGQKPNAGHAVYVQGEGPGGSRKAGFLWWMNPLAPWTYQGEWIPTAVVQAYAWGIGQSGLVQEGAWRSTGGPNVPGDSMPGFTLLPGPPGTVTLKGAGHYYLKLSDNTLHGPLDPATFAPRRGYPIHMDEPVHGAIPGQDRQTAWLIGDEAAALLASDVTVAFAPAPVIDCGPAVAAATAPLNDRIAAAKAALG